MGTGHEEPIKFWQKAERSYFAAGSSGTAEYASLLRACAPTSGGAGSTVHSVEHLGRTERAFLTARASGSAA